MADASSSAAGSSASRLDRFLSRLSRTMTPPKVSIRSRRGILSPSPLGVDGVKQDAGSAIDTTGLTPEQNDTWQRHQGGSARATTLRKREKVAELRRRRQQNLLSQRRQSQYSAMSPAAVAPGAADLASLAAMVSPPAPRPGTHNQPLSSMSDAAWRDPLPARRGLAVSGEDRFFDSPELNLLLQPIDLDAVVSVVDPTPPSQRTGGKKRAGRAADRTPARDELDFTINIPSTSLSPMVPFGLGHGRQRSRTAVFMAGRGVPAEGATDGGQPRRQPARPHAFAGATGAPGDTAAAAAATPDGSSSRVYQQIEEELARSRALKQELVRLGAVVSALEALALPDRSTLAAGQAHV